METENQQIQEEKTRENVKECKGGNYQEIIQEVSQN